jgi:nitrite reductase (NADH) small subunit
MTALALHEWELACNSGDLVEGSGVCALVKGVQVAIFYLPQLENPVFALDNHDPIGGANVLSRGIVGDLGGELVIASPLYKQHFNLRTGACLERDDVAVPVYRARLEGDRVLIALPA